MLGFIASRGERDLLLVETSRGAEQTVSTAKYEVTGRGGRGRELLQRGQFTRVITGRRAGSAGASRRIRARAARYPYARASSNGPQSAHALGMRSICKFDGQRQSLAANLPTVPLRRA